MYAQTNRVNANCTSRTTQIAKPRSKTGGCTDSPTKSSGSASTSNLIHRSGAHASRREFCFTFPEYSQVCNYINDFRIHRFTYFRSNFRTNQYLVLSLSKLPIEAHKSG